MSDETKIPESDDWLDDFEDASDDIFSELDQANIEALLSDSFDDKDKEPATNEETVSVPSEEDPPVEQAGKAEENEVKDLTTEAETGSMPEHEKDEEVGQGEIDDLLAKPDEDIPSEENGERNSDKIDQDAIDSLLDNEASEEISQGINALMGDLAAELPEPEPEEVVAGGELDKEDGGTPPEDVFEIEGAGPEEEAAEIEVASEDSEEKELFGGEDQDESAQPGQVMDSPGSDEGASDESVNVPQQEEALGQASGKEKVPSQEEMDQLFSEATQGGAKDDPFEDKDEEFLGDLGDESFTLGSAGGFDVDVSEFDLDKDIPDIPDEKEFASPSKELTEDAIAPPVGSGSEDDVTEYDSTQMILPQPFYQKIIDNRPIMGAIAGCLVVLIGLVMYLFSGSGAEKTIAVTPSQPVVFADVQKKDLKTVPETMDSQVHQIAAQQSVMPQINIVPRASDGNFQLEDALSDIRILLACEDDDGDPMQYDIISNPLFGTLEGEPPDMVYTPTEEFPGKDKFLFAVSDGKDSSKPATVYISGPDLRRKVPREPIIINPKRPLLLATNVAVPAVSTDDVIIDWKSIWQQANYIPYNSKVSVEILDNNLGGTLKKINPSAHRYTPPRFFSGQEELKYRFTMAGYYSKPRILLLEVETGEPPPEIHLHPLAQSAYTVGETVVLDAQETMDDDRDSLIFVWEQTSGTPIELVKLNDQASRITFMVPSSFNTNENPGPRVRLTVYDKTGQSDSKEIKINSVSRRQTALWGALRGIGVLRTPACPRGDCTAL